MDGSSSPGTAVLGHPHALVREGLSRVLSEMDFDVVQTGSFDEATRAVKDRNPALVLIDKEIISDDDTDLGALTANRPGMTVAVLARPEPQDDVAPMLQAGAGGYLSVDLSPDEFDRSLRLLLAGDIVVSRDLAGDFANSISTQNDDAHGLSEREREVLGLVGVGKTNREIAQDLIVTESTVKVHLRSVLDKLNLRNRQQAAAYAAKNGLSADEDLDEDLQLDAAEIS